jgi:hypothetical protein
VALAGPQLALDSFFELTAERRATRHGPLEPSTNPLTNHAALKLATTIPVPRSARKGSLL